MNETEYEGLYDAASGRRLFDEDVDVPIADDETSDLEVHFALRWSNLSDERVRGQLRARNVGAHTRWLSGKPGLRLWRLDGTLSESMHLVSADLQIPDFVLLGPGDVATSEVSFSWWDGSPLSGHVIVEWSGGAQTILATGPKHPSQESTHPMAASSGWFQKT